MKEAIKKEKVKHGYRRKGFSHYLYIAWDNMKRRCLNSKNKDFPNYGGRGISLFKDWNNFLSFKNYVLNELGERPEGCSLDRINNDGNYEPGNVRWATYTEQLRNTRRNYKVCRIDSEKNVKVYERLDEVKKDGFEITGVWRSINKKQHKYRGYLWAKKEIV